MRGRTVPTRTNARLVAATADRADVVVHARPDVRARLGAVSQFPARAVVDLAADPRQRPRARPRTPRPRRSWPSSRPTRTGTGSSRPRGRRSPGVRPGWAPRRSARRSSCGAAGSPAPRILTWLYAPGAPLREAVEADIDVTVVRRLGARRGGRRRARRRADRPRAPQGRHRAGPQRDDPGGPRGDPAGGPAAARPRGSSTSSVCGRTSRSRTSPTHPSVKQQGEVFAEALGRVEARRGRARGAAPGQLRGDPDQPGRPLRPRAAGHRRVRPVARPAARRARRLRPGAGDDGRGASSRP